LFAAYNNTSGFMTLRAPGARIALHGDDDGRDRWTPGLLLVLFDIGPAVQGASLCAGPRAASGESTLKFAVSSVPKFAVSNGARP